MRKSNEPPRRHPNDERGNESAPPPPADERPREVPVWDGCELRFRGRTVLRPLRGAGDLRPAW
jgi:hypothetical protein